MHACYQGAHFLLLGSRYVPGSRICHTLDNNGADEVSKYAYHRKHDALFLMMVWTDNVGTHNLYKEQPVNTKHIILSMAEI